MADIVRSDFASTADITNATNCVGEVSSRSINESLVMADGSSLSQIASEINSTASAAYSVSGKPSASKLDRIFHKGAARYFNSQGKVAPIHVVYVTYGKSKPAKTPAQVMEALVGEWNSLNVVFRAS